MRRSKAGTIEQARLIHTHKARIYNNHGVIIKGSKQKARIQSQKETAKEILPTKTDTRQHLKQFYFGKTGATHRHLHKTPKKKKSGDFPARVVPLGDRILDSLRRGALSSCRA